MVGHQLVIRYYVVTFELKTKKACNFIKKETLAHVFSCEIAKFLQFLFLRNTSCSCFGLYRRGTTWIWFLLFLHIAKMDMYQVFSADLLSDLQSKSIDWFLYEGNTVT